MHGTFDFFVSPDFAAEFVEETNIKIKETLSGVPTDKSDVEDALMYLRRVTTDDECEVHALINLTYFRGLKGLNGHSVSIIFSERAGHQLFAE